MYNVSVWRVVLDGIQRPLMSMEDAKDPLPCVRCTYIIHRIAVVVCALHTAPLSAALWQCFCVVILDIMLNDRRCTTHIVHMAPAPESEQQQQLTDIT